MFICVVRKKDRRFGCMNIIIDPFGIIYPLAIILYEKSFLKYKPPYPCVLRYNAVSTAKEVPTFRRISKAYNFRVK